MNYNLIQKDLRHSFTCYIVDEDDWDSTYECLSKGHLVECGKEALGEFTRLIEEFDEDAEDYAEGIATLNELLSNPKAFLSEVKVGNKVCYVGAPLGYTISIE